MGNGIKVKSVSFITVSVVMQTIVMLCSAAFATRGVLNCPKIKNRHFSDKDSNIDAKQEMEHKCQLNMMNMVLPNFMHDQSQQQ